MKKMISMLLIFTLMFATVIPSFAAEKATDAEYARYQNALKNVEKSKLTDEEKVVMKQLIKEKYEYIVAKKSGQDIEALNIEFESVQTLSYPPFECIAVYSKSVDRIALEANKLMAYGSISGGIGLFATKVPYIGTGITAAGGFFGIAGGLMYLSVADLKAGSDYVGETWFRWTDEVNYTYQVYTKTYVEYDGTRISEVKQSAITDGDWDS
ncbi:hypothetical protein [Thermotalea metallivorans]|uniref:Uncharacterized protein n=1 Tax=Thermotalea metallivorans TaxID=520762 RepID=A0A140KZ79_9FIRM|nr:hypothetical protein [Thermotalea metallivorans]KXG73604.1 hypothetical protein AN619_30670 [Thermotalea metallivorans]